MARVPTARETQVAGIGAFDVGRFIEKNIAGRQTPVGGFVRGMGEIAAPAARDIVSLPVAVPTGTYQTGRALVKAARGDPRELKQLGESFVETDPIALAARGRFGEAAESFAKHPGLGVLEVAGAAGTAGRLASRASRGQLPGRAPRRAPARRVKTAPGIRMQRREPTARGAIGLFQRARDKAVRDPGRLRDKDFEHAVDVIEGAFQAHRRPSRGRTAKRLRQTVYGGRGGRPVKRGARESPLSAVVQGITDASKRDVGAYIRELDVEHKRMKRDKGVGRGQVKANRNMRAVLADSLERGLDPDELLNTARAYAGQVRPLEQEVIRRGMLDPEEAERARLLPAVSRPGKGGVKRVRLEDGRRVLAVAGGSRALSTAEMRAMASKGRLAPEDIAFVTQAPGGLGGKAFGGSYRTPKGISGKARTGEAVRRGLVDLDRERLVEHGVKLQGMIDSDDYWRHALDELGYRGKGEGLATFESRQAAARNLDDDGRPLDPDGEPIEGAPPMVAIRAVPWQGRQSQLRNMLDEADDEGFTPKGEHPLLDAMESALKGEDGEGPWALIPKAAADQMIAHAEASRWVPVPIRAATQAFRRTVLPLSVSWLFGNFMEGVLRTAVAGAGPTSWLRYRKVNNELARMDPKAAERMLARLPSGHYGGMDVANVRGLANQVSNKRLRAVAQSMSAFDKRPGVGTFTRTYRAVTDWVFHSVNQRVESQFTRAMAGRYVHENLMPREGRQAAETAVQQAARGLRNTAEQDAMASFVRRAYGQYESFPPGMRKALAFAPFLPWQWNAVKFLASVLPNDHPTLLAAIAAQDRVTEQFRRENGLEPYEEGAVPDFLQGSVPLPGGGHLRVGKYTPFGVMADPLGTAASNVLPQFGGPLQAMRGLDFKGDPVRGPRGVIAARELAFALIPGVGLAARATGTLGQKKRGAGVFNPLSPVEPPEQEGPSGGGGIKLGTPQGGRIKLGSGSSSGRIRLGP